MPINIPRGNADPVIDEIVSILDRYGRDHPHAEIDIYRQNPVSVRVRIIDPDFAGQGKTQRHDRAWEYLNSLSDDAQGDISTLILLAPEERSKSFANFEFEDPIPSKL